MFVTICVCLCFFTLYLHICLHAQNISEKIHSKLIIFVEGIGGWKTVEGRALTFHCISFWTFRFLSHMYVLSIQNYFYFLTAFLRWTWHSISCAYLKCTICFNKWIHRGTITTIKGMNIFNIPQSFLVPLCDPALLPPSLLTLPSPPQPSIYLLSL